MTPCSLFILHTTLNEPIGHEISLSNKATLSHSDLIWMFFISYDACERCFYFLKAKQTCLYFTFQRCSFKERILIMTDKYSWQNLDQRKSTDNREIRIIKVHIIEVRLYSEKTGSGATTRFLQGRINWFELDLKLKFQMSTKSFYWTLLRIYKLD